MKKIGILVLMLVLATNSLAMAAGDLKWFTLKEGMEKAKAENKTMIVDFFYGKGCPRCEFLQTKVYDDPGIAEKIRTDFIPIKIDLAKELNPEEEALGKKHEYKKDCLLLFLDPKGSLIVDPDGTKFCFIDKIDPDQFIRYLDKFKATKRAE